MLDRPNMPDMEAVFTLMGWALRGGGKQRECGCPLCGSIRAGTVNTEENLFHCFKCQAKAGDALDLYRQATGAAFAQAATDLGCWIDDQGKAITVATHSHAKAPARPVERAIVSEDARAYLQHLQADSRPYPGTVVAAHLKARGCLLPPEGAVRYLPNLKHRSGYAGPAMFSLVTDILTGEIVGGHRTWVAEDGTKPVSPARMTMGQKKGAVVRLWPDEDVTHGLGIAEGIGDLSEVEEPRGVRPAAQGRARRQTGACDLPRPRPQGT